MSDQFVGEIRMFGGNYAPMDWAFCDGALLNISQNDVLYSLIGTIYGGDGYTNFKLPDLRGRVPIHKGSGPGLSNRQLGSSFGAETAVLDTTHIPAHTHVITAGGDGTTISPAGNYPGNSVGFSLYSASTPSGVMNTAAVGMSAANPVQAHSNLMPSQCVNFIIAVSGFYPQRP